MGGEIGATEGGVTTFLGNFYCVLFTARPFERKSPRERRAKNVGNKSNRSVKRQYVTLESFGVLVASPRSFYRGTNDSGKYIRSFRAEGRAIGILISDALKRYRDIRCCCARARSQNRRTIAAMNYRL